MRQPPIDLMPDSIRTRSQAGAVVRRYVMALLLGVAVLIAPATHARIQLRNATTDRDEAKKQAQEANQSDQDAREIQKQLDDSYDFIRRYRQVAMPFEVSRLMATIVNDLTPSASLDRIDLHVVTPRRHGVPRGSTDDRARARFLHGELVGFAKVDGDAHDLAARINGLGLCDDAKVEYTRHREVRSEDAREFRISFRIDLNRPIEVVDRSGTSDELVGHVE